MTEDDHDETADAVISALESIVKRSVNRFVQLSWYRTVAREGYQTGITGADAARMKMLEALSDPVHGSNSPARLSFEWWSLEMRKAVESLTPGTFQLASDAACLIFAHAVLDGEVTDLCSLALGANPRKAADLLGGRQVELRAVRDQTYLDLLEKEIRKKERAVARQPLLNRVHFLLKHFCPGQPDVTAELPGYVFDLSRIERFDKLRNEIVHADVVGDWPANVEDELQFVQSTDVYLYLRFKHNFFEPTVPPEAGA